MKQDSPNKEQISFLYPNMMDQLNRNNPYRIGSSTITEIPLSALIASYQGTTMRISPGMNKLLGNVLHNESEVTGKPIVFLFHPNELISEVSSHSVLKRRSKSYSGYIFGDVIRRKLKLKNLGKQALNLLEGVLKKSTKEGFEFINAKNFRRIYRSKSN